MDRRGLPRPAVVAGSLLFCVAVVASIAARPTNAIDAALDPERVARGEYLVTIGGCHDCHTPWKVGDKGPEPDMTRMLWGHPQELVVEPAELSGPWEWAGASTNTAFSGPWGVSFTANLTPDPSGLGGWTEEIFIEALRSGRHWGQSRPILPPMPWFNNGRMTDEDLKAVFAYLQTLPPIQNHVPLPIPPGGSVEGDEVTF